MASRIKPRGDTATNFGAKVLAERELVVVRVDGGSGLIKGAPQGNGSDTVDDLLAAGKALAPLGSPSFVGPVNAPDSLLTGSTTGKGTRIGGTAERFTHQKLFVDGRVSNQIRAFRLNRTSDLAITGGVNQHTVIPMQAISSSPLDFASDDIMEDTDWFESVTTGGWKPEIPGWWHVTANLVVHVSSASTFPCARATLTRKTGMDSPVILSYGAGQQGPTGTPLLFLTVSDYVYLAAEDVLNPGVLVISAASPIVAAGPAIGGTTIGAVSSWMSGIFVGHDDPADSPE